MAACSAYPAAPCSGRVIDEQPIEFIAYHPFLYFAADKNDTILFLGTVVDGFQKDMKVRSFYFTNLIIGLFNKFFPRVFFKFKGLPAIIKF